MRFTSGWPYFVCVSHLPFRQSFELPTRVFAPIHSFLCRTKTKSFIIDPKCAFGRHKCATNAPQMRHKCATNAPQIRHKCATNAPQMRHKCTTNAPQKRHKSAINAPQILASSCETYANYTYKNNHCHKKTTCG